MTRIPNLCPGVRYEHIPGFLGYVAGDDGSVWSFRNKKCAELWSKLAPQIQQNGYQTVMLCGAGPKPKKMFTHRLVALAFYGEPENGFEVMHLDNDKSNNALSNLKYGTRKQNMQQCCAEGRQNRGAKNGRSKLTECNVIEIRRLALNGVKRSVIASQFRISPNYVREITSRRRWSYLPQE